MKKNIQINIKTGRKYVNIFGINILSTTREEVLTAVKSFVSDNTKFYITTPNPELVLASTKDSELKNALNSSTFAVPDGIGLAQSSKFLSMTSVGIPIIKEALYFFQGLAVGFATFANPKWLTRDLNIIKGRVLFNDLMAMSNKNKWKVFFLGGETGEAKAAAFILSKKFKNIKIEAFQGPIVDNNANPVMEVDIRLQKDAVDKINRFSPQILFVAMKNPKQEKWIYKHSLPLRGKNLNVLGMMAVGGTFRYISGQSLLPPKWMEKYGLEWVWRFITEPHRIKRIFNAWPVFPWTVFLYKLKK